MPKTLHADAFLFQCHPSPVGDGYTIVDEDGSLIERKLILQENLTSNEAELLAIIWGRRSVRV